LVGVGSWWCRQGTVPVGRGSWAVGTNVPVRRDRCTSARVRLEEGLRHNNQILHDAAPFSQAYLTVVQRNSPSKESTSTRPWCRGPTTSPDQHRVAGGHRQVTGRVHDRCYFIWRVRRQAGSKRLSGPCTVAELIGVTGGGGGLITSSRNTSSTDCAPLTRWDLRRRPAGHGRAQELGRRGASRTTCPYNPPRSIFDRAGSRKDMPDRVRRFLQLASRFTDRSANRYGIATRGSKSWATHPIPASDSVHPGGSRRRLFNGSELARRDGQRTMRSNSPRSGLRCSTGARSAGRPTRIPMPTAISVDGKARMGVRRRQRQYPKEANWGERIRPEISHGMPAPARRGRPTTRQPVDVEVWAMNDNSRNKSHSGAVFIHWATGKDSLNRPSESGKLRGPVRKSVFDPTTFKRVAVSQPGYLEAFETVIGVV